MRKLLTYFALLMALSCSVLTVAPAQAYDWYDYDWTEDDYGYYDEDLDWDTDWNEWDSWYEDYDSDWDYYYEEDEGLWDV